MQPQKWPKQLQPDNILPDKLSDLVNNIENLLKPYQYTFVVRTENKNGKVTKIKLETELMF